jgi:SAM-dependent methyltransferase
MEATDERTIPHGDRCLWQQEVERFDRMLGPFGEAALDAARPAAGERVLDVGCGAGGTAIAAAHLVGSAGRVVGVDLDPRQIGLARARTAGLRTVELVATDATTFHDPIGFDVVFSRFGMMLFADPAAAFGSIAATARAGGRIAYVTWTRPEANLWFAIPHEVAGLPVPADAPGPFSLADAATNADLLASAGWTEVDVQVIERPTWVGADLGDALGFLARFLGHRVDPNALGPILDEAGRRMDPFVGSDGVELPGVALLCTAAMPHASGASG